MQYDFSGLTPERGAANIRDALASYYQGTKRDHALLDASLEICGIAAPEAPAAVEVPPEPLA